METPIFPALTHSGLGMLSGPEFEAYPKAVIDSGDDISPIRFEVDNRSQEITISITVRGDGKFAG